MTKHALLSPSSAKRWTQCPASVFLTKDVPDQPSAYAQEGTTAHGLAELLLTDATNQQVQTYIQENIEGKYPDMVEHVGVYVDEVTATSAGAEFCAVEMRVDLSCITGEDNAAGTADSVVLKNGVLTITDLKYGMGVAVSAEHNYQLFMYALAAQHELELLGFEVNEVELKIVQPRLGVISTWRPNEAERADMTADIQHGASRALELVAQPEGVLEVDFAPSEDACRFCKGKATCPALAKLVQAEFEVLDEVPTPELSKPQALAPEVVSKYLTMLPVMRQWADDIEAKAYEMACQGVAIPGYKLVAGRKSTRKWVDDAEAERKLANMKVRVEDRTTSKVISPTQAEKLVKKNLITERQWNNLQELIVQGTSKPQLVVESDKRQAINFTNTDGDFFCLDE